MNVKIWNVLHVFGYEIQFDFFDSDRYSWIREKQLNWRKKIQKILSAFAKRKAAKMWLIWYEMELYVFGYEIQFVFGCYR